MKNTARKTCQSCCPANENWTNVHDRATSEDGSPVWRCRCCGTEQPRRIRRSAVALQRERNPEAAARVDALAAKIMAEIEADSSF